jgi:hypothetical protein
VLEGIIVIATVLLLVYRCHFVENVASTNMFVESKQCIPSGQGKREKIDLRRLLC